MADIIAVQVNQISRTAGEGAVRDHSVLIDRPVAKGGENKGAMGGELLLIALGGCFMSNLLAAIDSRAAQISEVRVEIEGDLENSPARFSEVRMRVFANYDDKALMEKLVTISERACIVANTLKQAVSLSIRLD